MAIRQWNVAARGELSLEKINESLEHPERYRVALNRYPPGTAFSGHTRDCEVYLISGSCRYQHFGGEEVLTANQVLNLPAGKYRLEVIGTDEAEEVKVWLLPEAVWPT